MAALHELAGEGTYQHSLEELGIGARLAWRNHDRCVGRKHWRALDVLDARTKTTAAGIAQACWEHLERATNGGAVRSMITIGPPADADGRAFRILNSQLIRYAGYRTRGGIVGDPANLELTELAMDLGWSATGGPFDVLPLMIHTPDDTIRYFLVPPELVMEVPISHPEFSWFAELGLKWHAVPAVSNMDLEIGGITYPCAPFNGWYVSSEIGRNLGDTDRYDMLPAIADRMNLDCSSDRTLWRDQSLIELSRAILHSYRQSRVHLVDHHTVARQFVDHVDREHAAGRTCPTDWSWVNPPLSASLTPTFHRYFDPPESDARPAFLRRDTALPVVGAIAQDPPTTPMPQRVPPRDQPAAQAETVSPAAPTVPLMSSARSAAAGEARSAAVADSRPAAVADARPAAGVEGRPAAVADARPAAVTDARPAAVATPGPELTVVRESPPERTAPTVFGAAADTAILRESVRARPEAFPPLGEETLFVGDLESVGELEPDSEMPLDAEVSADSSPAPALAPSPAPEPDEDEPASADLELSLSAEHRSLWRRMIRSKRT